MRSRLPIVFWLPVGALLSVALWYGCEQKGDLSPVTSGQDVLTFIDTVIVDPPVLSPQGVAVLDAYIVNENSEPAPGEDVRFRVNRGTFASGTVDTTITTDNYGRARTNYTAPPDTGNVSFSAELLSMADVHSLLIPVRSQGQTLGGLLSVTVGEDTLFADNGASTTQVNATLRNEQNNPVTGASISFSTTAGLITSPAITNASGVATATLTSSSYVGQAIVRVTFNMIRDSVSVSFLAPSPAGHIDVTSSRAQITAGLDSAVVTANVFAENGLQIANNTMVVFSTTGGTLSNVSGRTVGGEVTTTLRAPNSTGEVTVTASTGTVSSSINLEVTPGPVAFISVTAENDTLIANNSDATQIVATVIDDFGNPVIQGTTISFTASGGSVNQSASVDATGHAIVQFRAGLITGPAAVIASNTSVQGSTTIYLTASEPASIALTITPSQLPADGVTTATLRAQVLDVNTSPVSDGTEVVFTSELGQLAQSVPVASRRDANRGTFRQRSISNGLDQADDLGSAKDFGSFFTKTRNSKSLDAVLTVTTVNGYATVTLTSGTVAGEDMITATANDVTDEVSAQYVAGEAASIVITPGVTALPADGVSSTTVSCRVVDSYGNPLGGGVAITVSATLGTMTPSQGYTNPSGVFTSNLRTNRTQGTCAIIASSNQASGYNEISFTAPSANQIVMSADEPSILANGISSTMIRAYVGDEYGLPVQGAAVEWSTGVGIGRLVPLSLTTNTEGIATAQFFSGASATDAQQTVQVTSGVYDDDMVVSLRGVTVEAAVTSQSLPADGESTAQVNATIRETSSGMAVSGATVRFAATTGSVQQVATTDESGIASAIYHSGSEAGEATITCSYGDTLRTQTSILLTNTEAELLVVTIADEEILANGITSTVVSAVVYNAGGQTVPNTTVTFTTLGSGYFSLGEAITNESGYVSSVFHSVALEQDEEAGIDVAIENSNIVRSIMLRGVTLQMTSTASQLPANGAATATLTIRLRETSSFMGVPEATILIGSNFGTINSAVATDSAGTARLTYTAGMEIGMAEIIARYGNLLTDTVHIAQFAPAAALLNLSATESSMLGDGAETNLLSTLITDQSGTPVSGTQVTWWLTGPGSLLSGQTITNQYGVATNYFRSPATYVDVTSKVHSSSASATDSVTIESRGVTIDVTSAVQQLPANGVSSVTVQTQLRETTSMVGIAGATVSFGTSLGYIPASVITNESGIIVTTLTAGDVVGNAVVIARYGNLLTDTMSVNFYSPYPATAEMDLVNNSLRADGMTSTDVTVYIYDELGVPLVGAPVSWTATGVPWTPVQSVTNFAGSTTIAFTSAALNNDAVAVLTATAGIASATANIMLRGVTLDVTATPQTVIADGGSPSTINVHVYETTSQIAVSGAQVYFGTDRGTIANTALTNAAGIASAILSASTQTGAATVTASYGNSLSAQTTVIFAVSTPTTLSLTANPTILLADNASNSTLTAVLTDQNGNPVPNGTQVRFSIPPQSGSLENLRTTVNGVAQNVLTSSSTPDTVQIVVWAEEIQSVRDSVTLIYRAGTPAVVTVSAASDSLRADGIQTDSITATVTDAVGHPLPNVEVLFSTTIGNITLSKTTNSIGKATVPFSSSQTGTAQIQATAGTAIGYYTLYLIPGTPNSIQLTYFPGSVGVRASGRNETLLVTARVQDANNNPVIDGTEVFFNINNSPGGGDFLSSTNAIPTINGEATVSYNSGTISGTARIRAICHGRSAVSTEILIYAGPPYIEDIADGCTTSHMSLGSNPCNMFGMDVVGDSVHIVALVGDRYNNPVTPGTAVYFTTSGGVVTTSTGYTDSAGFAHVTLFSGNPLPTVSRWTNTLRDPNLGTAVLCSDTPDQDGMAKLMARTAGVDATGDSVIVWATTNVVFDYSQPLLYIRDVSVGGDPNERELFIGQNALIRIALYDWNFWPMVAGTEIRFSATSGNVYPSEIIVPCPGDTSLTVSYFNSLTLSDDDAASPVLIEVAATHGAAYAFTETFTLRASLPPTP
jgi:adhesin/invasin